MPKKPFTKEEMQELRANENVLNVTEMSVQFTEAFKKAAYQKMVGGTTMRKILEECGINHAVLGNRRVWGIAERLRERADREEGFVDQRKENHRVKAKASTEQTIATRLSQLEHELAYTRQEVEFLKKIQAADLEARKAWESKHRLK